ncbi:MAG: hypothetical protein LBD75_04490 [Candidatus Peribacteria bacterium]|nr:hypothetical protein [Candidatus Peribacteria bacterium]
MPNVEAQVNFTFFIEKYPILFFILALLVLLFIITYFGIPKILSEWKKHKEKSKLTEIHKHTTEILTISRELKEKF